MWKPDCSSKWPNWYVSRHQYFFVFKSSLSECIFFWCVEIWWFLGSRCTYDLKHVLQMTWISRVEIHGTLLFFQDTDVYCSNDFKQFEQKHQVNEIQPCVKNVSHRETVLVTLTVSRLGCFRESGYRGDSGPPVPSVLYDHCFFDTIDLGFSSYICWQFWQNWLWVSYNRYTQVYWRILTYADVWQRTVTTIRTQRFRFILHVCRHSTIYVPYLWWY